MFADLDLARRLEAAEAAKYAAYARARPCVMPEVNPAVLEVAGGVAVYAGPGSPYNRAVGIGLHGPVSESEFERMEGFFANYGVTPQVSLCPLADRSLLGHLASRRYRIDMFMHTWVREISPAEDFHLPRGIIICPANYDEATLWTRVAFKGGLDSEEAEPGRAAVIAAYPYMAHTTCYLAWIDGEAAGAATLSVDEGLAELFGASTPAFLSQPGRPKRAARQPSGRSPASRLRPRNGPHRAGQCLTAERRAHGIPARVHEGAFGERRLTDAWNNLRGRHGRQLIRQFEIAQRGSGRT